MMESPEKHYNLLLSKDELELVKLYFESSEESSKLQTQKRICDLLIEKPYPVLDILLLKWTKYKYNIKPLLLKTLEDLLNRAPKEGFTPKIQKFLNKIPEEILQNSLEGRLREPIKKCLREVNLSSEFYLSIIGRDSKQATMHFILELMKENQWQYFQKPLGTKEYILYQALENKTHFLTLIAKQVMSFNDIKDVQLRNNLIILKLVQTFSMTTQLLSQLPNVQQCLEYFDIETLAEDLRPVYNYFYKDFKRLNVVLNYVKKFEHASSSITVHDVLMKSSNLEMINKYKLLNNYDEAKAFIDEYNLCQNSLTNSVKDSELETVCHYFILCHVFEMIVTPSNEACADFYAQKLQSLNYLLRQMKNFTFLCQILEDILRITFLRWEHFQKGSEKLTASSDESYTDDEVLPATSSKKKNKGKQYHKTGFMCTTKTFAELFNFLKAFVTKKLHSADFKNACSDDQCRFQDIVDYITEMLWKYSLLEKLELSQRQSEHKDYQIYLDPELLPHFVYYHADAIDRVSSDDEEKQTNYQSHYTSLSRRKAAKKRRRATFSGTIDRPKDSLSMQECRARANALSNSVSNIEPLKHLDICNNKRETAAKRSIIFKLMESPQRLVVLALSLKSYTAAKQIIENFNLQNSQLNTELTYVEQQQNITQKLSKIYDNYQLQEKQTHNSNEPLATVEQIRNVAAKGFEVSKIINVIDNFAQAQRIKQTGATKDLIQKHKQNPQYRFLMQFEESNLNAVVICDLIINLPFNRDIISSILMVIKRHQSIQSSFREAESLEKSQLPKNIGPLSLLENLNDCMRLLDGKSVRDLLCDNTYSLRPQKLSEELSREKIFKEIFYKTSAELSHCGDLKSLNEKFLNLKSKCDYFQRFCNYVHHLTKLVHLRDPNCEYHIEELLKIDPCDVVGELIFNCDMTPLEIEANVTALNLNLTHVIALSICPEIVGKCSGKRRQLTAQKQETIFNYISNYNRLLVYLLKAIYSNKDFAKDDPDIDSTYLERILRMSEIDGLSTLYDGNKIIATLRSDHVNMKLLENIQSKKEQLELLQLDFGVQEPKSLKSKRIDSLIVDLIEEDAKNMYLSPRIHDIATRANLIYKNFTKIPTTRLAKDLIETTLKHRQAVQRIPEELRQQLEATLVDITIYAKVSEVMQFETWPQAYDFSLKTPNTIFERLLQLRLYKLCYEWCNVVKLADNFKPQRKHLLNILFNALTDMSEEQHDIKLNMHGYLLRVLETFPQTDCIAFLENNKDKFRSMVLLKYAIGFLESYQKSADKEIYKNYKISITIFEQLSPSVRSQFWNLMKFPLLIIEQLIMNAKFEILTKVLKAVRKDLDRKVCLEKGESPKLCPFCFDKNGNIYDLHAKNYTPLKTRFQLGVSESTDASAFILLNFNLYQNDHFLTNDCIDLLLRIYATKALDYQISDAASSSEPCSQSTSDTQQSLDSLCSTFQIPSQAPTRAEWIRDEEATHCMRCRSAAFTMLMRRHHCRRCGRVVCFACSTYRMRIPELYEDVEVRICTDCYRLCDENLHRTYNRDSVSTQPEGVDNIPVKSCNQTAENFKWKLSGILTHDKLLREEFCYEHAPSVALCLSILEFHLDNQKCVDLLLFHCRKLEKLIIPNPEVHYELVAKMMNCLALAAKVRGAPAIVETIQEHSDIITSVVQNGCEALIPPDPLNNNGLRKLADSLVQAERWDLALEVHLKRGFPTAGIIAAHGLSCLRVGCYETAREKFLHCMPKLTNEVTSTALCKVIFNTGLLPSSNGNLENILCLTKDQAISVIRRPQLGPPLLQEILKLIESLPLQKTRPETWKFTSILQSTNSTIVSSLDKRKTKKIYVKRTHEPALNILNSLASLKHGSTKSSETPVKRKDLFRQTSAFQECMYYVLTYGSHADVIKFLMHHNDIMATLKYFLLQKLEPDLFVEHILLVQLEKGKMPQLISHLREIDSRLLLWRTVLLQSCRYFETHNLLNSLYQLQILLDDPIRASMTCVKFYTMNCENYQQQHTNAMHLHNAHLHLQTELENSHWELVDYSASKSQKNNTAGGIFQMQMDARALNTHINTILKQLDVAKFLAKCEVENSSDDVVITEKFLKQIRMESNKTLPTLFDNVQEKIQICILILLCGKNIEEGFGLAYRIIQDYKLPSIKIFAATAKVLARNQRLSDVDKLLNCVTSNNGVSTRDIDEILSVAINSATNSHEIQVKTALDNLAKKISNIDLRISSHIFIGQLKSAYLLANKYKRLSDIRKILRQAEATNQVHIKKLCEKKLQMSQIDANT